MKLKIIASGGYSYFCRNGFQWFDVQRGDRLPIVRFYGADEKAALSEAATYFRAQHAKARGA